MSNSLRNRLVNHVFTGEDFDRCQPCVFRGRDFRDSKWAKMVEGTLGDSLEKDVGNREAPPASRSLPLAGFFSTLL
jgi:hypothetical protein